MTASTIQKTTAQVRFNAAMKSIRKVGVTTRINFQTCCRGCAVFPDNTAILWTMAGQGNAFAWFDGVMVNRNVLAKLKRRNYGYVTMDELSRARGIEKEIYFYFTDIVAAEAAQIAFEAEGFEVEWDGTDIHAVLVKM
jgi:hypothetical protein